MRIPGIRIKRITTRTVVRADLDGPAEVAVKGADLLRAVTEVLEVRPALVAAVGAVIDGIGHASCSSASRALNRSTRRSIMRAVPSTTAD